MADADSAQSSGEYQCVCAEGFPDRCPCNCGGTMSDITITGYWTMVLGSEGELLAAHEGPATEDYNGLTPVPAVPCDDTAIQRAVSKLYATWPQRPTTPEETVELVLRAAGNEDGWEDA